MALVPDSQPVSPLANDIQAALASSVGRRLLKRTADLIRRHLLIVQNDRILIAISGGKDSWTLLFLLEHLRRASPVPFTIHPVHVYTGLTSYDPSTLTALSIRGIPPVHVERTHIVETVSSKATGNSSYCAFCARLRRGVLGRLAQQLQCTSMALGHHADDFTETFLLSLFFAGKLTGMQIKSFRPRIGITVIRPLANCWEEDIKNFIQQIDVPILDKTCPFPHQASPSRAKIKTVLADLERSFPGVKRRMHAGFQALASGTMRVGNEDDSDHDS